MDANRTWAFAGVAFLVILFPGPSVLFIISRSLSLGRVPALITVGGNALGEFVQVAAVAFGIGALVAASTVAFITIKLLGAAYLVYLGIQTIRRARHGIGSAPPASATARRQRVLWQGIVVGITNPKTMVFFAAVLPQFVVVKLGHVPLQLLILGLVWVAIALVSDTRVGARRERRSRRGDHDATPLSAAADRQRRGDRGPRSRRGAHKSLQRRSVPQQHFEPRGNGLSRHRTREAVGSSRRASQQASTGRPSPGTRLPRSARQPEESWLNTPWP